MSMKTILVPTEQTDLSISIFETALLLARQFDSYVEGFALGPRVANAVPVDTVGGTVLPVPDWQDEEVAGKARDLFEAFMQGRGIPRRGDAMAGPSFGWLDGTPAGDGFLGSYGRVFDAIVVGRPGSALTSPRVGTLETALFESGRPVLIAPPVPPERLGDSIAIAWNGSTEAARAIAFAMSLLERASRVVVLTVEGGMVPGPTGEQLARCLQRNGIAAEPFSPRMKKQSAGEAFLAGAALLGSDLLIKGAYTRSRLRHMIFGGATSHILAAANLPVLMAR